MCSVLNVSCLPQTVNHCSPCDSLNIPFCSSWFPCCEWAFLRHFSSSQFPTRHAGPFPFPLFFFFLSFILPSCMEIFLVMLGVQGLLLQFSRCSVKSTLNIHWKDWCWNWSSKMLATWCEEPTHWRRPWRWERLKAGGEGDDRDWDGWMASLTQWI